MAEIGLDHRGMAAHLGEAAFGDLHPVIERHHARTDALHDPQVMLDHLKDEMVRLLIAAAVDPAKLEAIADEAD